MTVCTLNYVLGAVTHAMAGLAVGLIARLTWNTPIRRSRR